VRFYLLWIQQLAAHPQARGANFVQAEFAAPAWIAASAISSAQKCVSQCDGWPMSTIVACAKLV
jgi:hypothetical protein